MTRELPDHVRDAMSAAGKLMLPRKAVQPDPEIRLVLPSPPSGNRYWRVPKALGRPILSREAREYRERVKTLAFAQGARSPFEGPVLVDVTWTRPRRVGDLDNALKVVLDALQGVAFDNDSQVVELRARRQDREAGTVGLLVAVRRVA